MLFKKPIIGVVVKVNMARIQKIFKDLKKAAISGKESYP